MEIEEIFSKLPFNNYSDLFNAIRNNKATIKFNVSDCCQISNIRNKHTYTEMLIPFIINAILLILFSIYFEYYLALILIPLNLILTYLLPYISMVKTISWIVLFIQLFIIRLPYILFLASINILLFGFFYNIWWNRTFLNAILELEYNEEAFLWSWNRYGITIEDVYGNAYQKEITHNKIIHCNSCNNIIKDDWIYCNFCGYKLKENDDNSINNDWQEYLEKNFNSSGTRTYAKDIKSNTEDDN